MPRKKTKSLQRKIAPDRRYNSVLVAKLINKSMLGGKKLLSERLVYQGMETAAKKLKKDNPLEVLEASLKNVYPVLEVK